MSDDEEKVINESLTRLNADEIAARVGTAARDATPPGWAYVVLTFKPGDDSTLRSASNVAAANLVTVLKFAMNRLGAMLRGNVRHMNVMPPDESIH